MTPTLDPQQLLLILAMAFQGAGHGPHPQIPQGLHGSFMADPTMTSLAEHSDIKIDAHSLITPTMKCQPVSLSGSGLRSQGDFVCTSYINDSKPYNANLRLRLSSDGRLQVGGFKPLADFEQQYLPTSAAHTAPTP